MCISKGSLPPSSELGGADLGPALPAAAAGQSFPGRPSRREPRSQRMRCSIHHHHHLQPTSQHHIYISTASLSHQSDLESRTPCLPVDEAPFTIARPGGGDHSKRAYAQRQRQHRARLRWLPRVSPKPATAHDCERSRYSRLHRAHRGRAPDRTTGDIVRHRSRAARWRTRVEMQ